MPLDEAGVISVMGQGGAQLGPVFKGKPAPRFAEAKIPLKNVLEFPFDL